MESYDSYDKEVEEHLLAEARRNDEVSEAASKQPQGRIADAPPSGFDNRVSYSDPVADGMDPTDPDSPENNSGR
jgi:hypothetical protein